MKQFIRKESLNNWDIWSIVVYAIITIGVFYIGINIQQGFIWLISIYSFGTPMFLYIFNYRSLRKIYVFLIWFLISLIQIWLYSILHDNPAWVTPIGNHWADGLQLNWIVLIYYQLARFIHLKIKKNELVSACYGSNYDLHDDRKIDYLDYIFFAIFIISWIFLIR